MNTLTTHNRKDITFSFNIVNKTVKYKPVQKVKTPDKKVSLHELEPLVPRSEVAKFCNVHDKTLYKLFREVEVPVYLIGKQKRYRVSEVVEALALNGKNITEERRRFLYR